MNTQPKTFTPDQRQIVNELCTTHGLAPEQISFDGDALNPIFDYEAACALSLKLTDIASIETKVKDRDPMRHQQAVAVCTVTLPDGRTRTVEDSAEIGEEYAPGLSIETRRDADGMAQNRAVRRGIRSVGINLYNAHKAFMQTGEATPGSTDIDPRTTLVKEVHALAGPNELDYTRDEYEELIAAGYDGRTSTTDLTDKELENFAKLLRSLRRVQRSRQEFKAAA